VVDVGKVGGVYCNKNEGSRLRFESYPPPHPQGGGGGINFGIIRRPSSTETTFILDIMSSNAYFLSDFDLSG